MTAQPTTYQITKFPTSNSTLIEFTDPSRSAYGEDRLDMTVNHRNDEISFSAPYGGPDGEEDYTIIIVEADVLVAALRQAGLI